MTRTMGLSLLLAGLHVACGGAGRAPAAGPPVEIATATPTDADEPPEDAEPAPVPSTATPPALTHDRLPRFFRRPIAMELLSAELDALERLLAATPESSPDYATLLRRVAYSYFELYLREVETDPERAKQSLARADELIGRAPSGALPPTGETLYIVGLVREQRANFSGARQAYAAAAADPKAPADVVARAYYGLALLAELSGATGEAARSYESARDWLARLGLTRDEDRDLYARIDERARALGRGVSPAR